MWGGRIYVLRSGLILILERCMDIKILLSVVENLLIHTGRRRVRNRDVSNMYWTKKTPYDYLMLHLDSIRVVYSYPFLILTLNIYNEKICLF